MSLSTFLHDISNPKPSRVGRQLHDNCFFQLETWHFLTRGDGKSLDRDCGLENSVFMVCGDSLATAFALTICLCPFRWDIGEQYSMPARWAGETQVRVYRTSNLSENPTLHD